MKKKTEAQNEGNPEVTLVTKNGDFRDDGILKKLTGTHATIDGRTVLLRNPYLLLQRVPEEQLRTIEVGTPLVLSIAWGCGGDHLLHGTVAKRAWGGRITINVEGRPRQVEVERFGAGVFKVLWSKGV